MLGPEGLKARYRGPSAEEWRDVLYDFLAALLREVNVDFRWLVPLLGNKAFESQFIGVGSASRNNNHSVAALRIKTIKTIKPNVRFTQRAWRAAASHCGIKNASPNVNAVTHSGGSRGIQDIRRMR
jgi:hypothetical protein